MNVQSVINASAGVFGAIITFAFGHWTEALSFLLTAIAIDVITGVYASLREGCGLSSSIGGFGLAKKGLILLVILLAHRVDVLLEMDMAMGGSIYFYIINELLSIIENYGSIGLPLPDVIKRAITVLRDKGDATNGASKTDV